MVLLHWFKRLLVNKFSIKNFCPIFFLGSWQVEKDQPKVCGLRKFKTPTMLKLNPYEAIWANSRKKILGGLNLQPCT